MYNAYGPFCVHKRRQERKSEITELKEEVHRTASTHHVACNRLLYDLPVRENEHFYNSMLNAEELSRLLFSLLSSFMSVFSMSFCILLRSIRKPVSFREIQFAQKPNPNDKTMNINHQNSVILEDFFSLMDLEIFLYSF